MTQPTGKMSWGQAGSYDAFDDRVVIAAVTKGRTGLAFPAIVEAGTGLNVIVRAPWAGVADCLDLTSGVVGSALDQTVLASPGPASGTRTDVLWCDVYPDEGTWALRIIPQPQTAGLPGMPIATLAVPAGANLASQMTITPDDSLLERRMYSIIVANMPLPSSGLFFWAESWALAESGQGAFSSAPVWMVPGQYYRVRYTIASVTPAVANTGSLSHRIGIGSRVAGQPASASVPRRVAGVRCVAAGHPQGCEVEWVFRWPRTDPLTQWVFDARYWSGGAQANYYLATNDSIGDHAVLTVEDVGS
jgi:hypothetical protein